VMSSLLPAGKKILPSVLRIAALLAVVTWVPSGFASLTTTVDRTSLSTIEVMTLIVRLENVNSDDSPDFSSLLSDFEIVQQSGPSIRQNLTIRNGRRLEERLTEWRLLLRPKRSGQLLVPALSLAGYQSRVFTVSVSTPSDSLKRQLREYVFIETEVDRDTTYVQGQLIYSVRLFHNGYISGDTPKAPELTDAIVEVLEPARRYEEVVDRRNYYVLEQTYGIYPLKSGTLALAPETFFGTRNVRGIRQRTERVSAISGGHEITVNPKPKAFPSDNWLPASALALTETWSPEQDTFDVGEPINRTITLTAQGVSSSVLPRLGFDAGGRAKTYTDPPVATDHVSATGTTGQLTTTVGIVPTEPGELIIPTVQIPWWNTDDESLRWAELPGRVITINATAAPFDAPPLQTSSPAALSPQIVTEVRYDPMGWYLTGLFLLLWLGTLTLLIKRRHGRPRSPTNTTSLKESNLSTPDPAKRLTQLRDACRNNDAEAVINALRQWLRATFGPSVTVTQWLQQQADAELTQQVTDLQASLFSSTGSVWQGGDTLIADIERSENARKSGASEHNTNANGVGLAALNPGLEPTNLVV